MSFIIASRVCIYLGQTDLSVLEYLRPSHTTAVFFYKTTRLGLLCGVCLLTISFSEDIAQTQPSSSSASASTSGMVDGGQSTSPLLGSVRGSTQR